MHNHSKSSKISPGAGSDAEEKRRKNYKDLIQ